MPPHNVTIFKQKKTLSTPYKTRDFCQTHMPSSLEDLYEENEWKLIMDWPLHFTGLLMVFKRVSEAS